MRDLKFQNGEYYHIYNRGTDKRKIFNDKNDIWRFIKGILVFNREKPVGSIRDELELDHNNSTPVTVDYEELIKLSGGLVEIVCVCINPNHYHLLLKQISDDGISKFLQRLGSGYTRYFNEKNKRNGVLFQGKFKAEHIKTNKQLLYISAYINRNYDVHGIRGEDLDLVFSSWDEYVGKNKVINMCKGKGIILDQFGNFEEYKEFAESVVKTARNLKEEKKKEKQKDHLE